MLLRTSFTPWYSFGFSGGFTGHASLGLQELLLGFGFGLGFSGESSGDDAVLVLVVKHEGQGQVGRDRVVGHGIKADHETLLLLLVAAVTINFELEVGHPTSETDQRIAILGTIQLGDHMDDLCWIKVKRVILGLGQCIKTKEAESLH